MSRLRQSISWGAVGPIVPVVAVLTIAVTIGYLLDEPPELAGEELKALIVGNTVQGHWGQDQVPYRQYVGSDGTTRTALDGDLLPGTWRIDQEGAYCAVLPTGEPGCYRARLQNDVYFWVDAENSLGYPFSVLPGEQLKPGATDQTSHLVRPAGDARQGLGDPAGF